MLRVGPCGGGRPCPAGASDLNRNLKARRSPIRRFGEARRTAAAKDGSQRCRFGALRKRARDLRCECQAGRGSEMKSRSNASRYAATVTSRGQRTPRGRLAGSNASRYAATVTWLRLSPSPTASAARVLLDAVVAVLRASETSSHAIFTGSRRRPAACGTPTLLISPAYWRRNLGYDQPHAVEAPTAQRGHGLLPENASLSLSPMSHPSTSRSPDQPPTECPPRRVASQYLTVAVCAATGGKPHRSHAHRRRHPRPSRGDQGQRLRCRHPEETESPILCHELDA